MAYTHALQHSSGRHFRNQKWPFINSPVITSHKSKRRPSCNSGLRERQDLQRILKGSIEVVAPDCLVIAEEFGEWTDGQRRIDLLAIDKDANIVVIELKRTQDGGHMELQAIRYASMVSAMTFRRAVEVFARYLGEESLPQAESQILDFLGWDEPSEEEFAADVRIVLASAEFSKELTTSVLWLNEKGLDIRCIRMKPYISDGETLINVEQVIPLPEAQEFQVSVREKRYQQRRERVTERDTAKRDLIINGEIFPRLPKRRIIYEVVSAALKAGANVTDIQEQMPNNKWAVADGTLSSEEFVEAMEALRESQGLSFPQKRYFCDDSDLFHIGGKTYALSNQWGTGTQSHVEKLQQKYALEISVSW